MEVIKDIVLGLAVISLFALSFVATFLMLLHFDDLITLQGGSAIAILVVAFVVYVASLIGSILRNL